MLLSARILSNVSNVNSFDYDNQATFTEGDVLSVHLQLIDSNKDKGIQGFNPSGRRYVPATGSVLTVTVTNIVTSAILTKSASQPFTSDGSIWSFPILTTDALKGGTYTIKLALTEGSNTTYGSLVSALSVVPKDGSFV